MFRRTLFLALTCASLAASLLSPEVSAKSAVPFPSSLSWYNVSRPLTLADLKGRAVLLDFFTPGCINCIHMLPAEELLKTMFGTRLVIVAIDSPDDIAASTPAGVQAFIQRYGLSDPILLDAKLTLWNAYGVRAWPTLFLLGPDGQVRKRFIGEQSWRQLAGPIKAALAGAPPASTLKPLPLRAMMLNEGVLATPSGIAVSPSLVAIADSGHDRIVLANHQGVVQAVIGDGCLGDADGSYQQAQFYWPHGLAFHDHALYVADTRNQLIRRIDLAKHTVATIAGSHQRGYVNSGDFPARHAVLDSPWDLAWYDGKLYVSMAGDHQIWQFAPGTREIGPWAGTGQEGLQDGSRKFAEFAQPSGLSLEGNTLYDVDPESHSVRAISMPRGSVNTLIGIHRRAYYSNFGLVDGSVRVARLQHDEGIVADGDDLYIADTFNDAVRRLDLRTQQVTTVAAAVQRPIAIAMLSPDTLLVPESTGNQIVAVHLPDGKVTPWPLSGLELPADATCSAL